MPAANLPDLHLPREIQRDVAAGRFRLWAVETLDQALELLLGTTAGTLTAGRYPKGSVYGRAGSVLADMSRRLFPPRSAPGAKGKKKSAGEGAKA